MNAANLFLTMRTKSLLVVSLAIILIVGGCRKDLMSDLDSIEQIPPSKTLTVQEAQKWWNSQAPLSFRSGDDSLTTNVSLLWDHAYQTLYSGEETIVIVPVYWDDIMKMNERGNVVLSIYNHPDNGGLAYRWLGYYAPYDAYPRPISQFSVNDYSGFFFEIDKRGYIQHVLRVQNGQINGYHPGASGSSRLSEIDFRDDEDFPRRRRRNNNNQGECPDWNTEETDDVYYNPGVCNDGFGSFFQWLGGLINSIFSGPHTNNSPPYISPFYNFGPGFNPGNESGPNNSSSLNQHFNNQIFHWTAEHAQLLEQFRIRNNINLPSHILMLIVNPSCFVNSEMSDVPEEGDEDALYDQCIFWSMLNWVNERASLSPEEYDDLKTNNRKLEDAVAFLLHLEASGFSRSEVESYMDSWFENYGAWDGLTEDEAGVICCNPPIVINNGIALADLTTPASPVTTSGLIKVGFSVGVYPDNFDDPNDDPEDIRSGTNGDGRGIYLDEKPAVVHRGDVIVPARPYTDSELFDFMTPLFRATTHCDNRSIALLFKEEFRNNTQRGKFFYHRPLSDKVMTHPVMKNYMKSFGKQLNDRLSMSNGQMTSQVIDMGTERPRFNKKCSDYTIVWYDRLHGYQILLNDTQATDIYLIPGSYIYDANTKVWRGRFMFVVTDHFGLDKKDAISYQSIPLGTGFSAWWRLQHTRGYKPFRTRIIISVDLQGTLN